MKKRTRKNSKIAILEVAVIVARKSGLHKFSRIDVAKEANVGEGTVSYHFGTMPELRTAIVQNAVKNEILSILADARAGRESIGVPMSEDLRKKVAAYIAS